MSLSKGFRATTASQDYYNVDDEGKDDRGES
jgi:hypothetical protein